MSTKTVLKPGDIIEGYQVISEAPAGHVRGSRTRPIEGHLIAGSWSQAMWLFSQEKGWALARRWKNRETNVTEHADGKLEWRPLAARDEIIITPWPPAAEPEEEQ